MTTLGKVVAACDYCGKVVQQSQSSNDLAVLLRASGYGEPLEKEVAS